jgi:hypothetical protein
VRFRAKDRSGRIIAGGVAQVLFDANPHRNGGWIQNHGLFDLWVNDLGVAASEPPSMKIPPGALFEFPEALSPDAISIWGPSTGQVWSAREW